MHRTLEDTHECLAKFSHMANDDLWGSVRCRLTDPWNYPMDADVAEATLEHLRDNAGDLGIQPPDETDFRNPYFYLKRIAKKKSDQFVINLLNFIVTNRLYGKKVRDEDDSDQEWETEKSKRRLEKKRAEKLGADATRELRKKKEAAKEKQRKDARAKFERGKQSRSAKGKDLLK
jgi:hypothetical protein